MFNLKRIKRLEESVWCLSARVYNLAHPPNFNVGDYVIIDIQSKLLSIKGEGLIIEYIAQETCGSNYYKVFINKEIVEIGEENSMTKIEKQ